MLISKFYLFSADIEINKSVEVKQLKYYKISLQKYQNNNTIIKTKKINMIFDEIYIND